MIQIDDRTAIYIQTVSQYHKKMPNIKKIMKTYLQFLLSHEIFKSINFIGGSVKKYIRVNRK